ncbi:helix-turn-helix domain-containing protein [Halalkalibacter flavus]|uniref:helix-turn-helix domain-containing protein n=1 Tax=Halalkalibacter flavus TaxID=3090668 RepID=UPI002FC8C802
MKVVRSDLKNILNERGKSIRKLAEETDLKFETLRRMYNDETKQYNREMLAKVCENLDITIDQLLILEETKEDATD